MEAFLLSVHVVAGILFVGPVAVAVSLFPRYARIDDSAARPPSSTALDTSVAWVLHRITRRYGVLTITVPIVGILLAFVQGRLNETWILIAMVLTAIAGGLLALQIAPRQREALVSPGSPKRLQQIAMLAGVFNLIWVVVVILMVIRPGSHHS